MMTKGQISCEWGMGGLLNCQADAVIIVDVLSFSTCIDLAVSQNALVYPYLYNNDSAKDFAKSKQAILAGARSKEKYSLSPYSLKAVPQNTRLVLPSPNGSSLTFCAKTRAKYILAGCLRNASAVAKAVMQFSNKIIIIPAGEKWPDGTMRVAYEDLIGTGAIIKELSGDKTTEAKMAEQLFEIAKKENFQSIYQCYSGQELLAANFKEDIDIAIEYNVSGTAPILQQDFFIALEI